MFGKGSLCAMSEQFWSIRKKWLGLSTTLKLIGRIRRWGNLNMPCSRRIREALLGLWRGDGHLIKSMWTSNQMLLSYLILFLLLYSYQLETFILTRWLRKEREIIKKSYRRVKYICALIRWLSKKKQIIIDGPYIPNRLLRIYSRYGRQIRIQSRP